MPMTPEVQRPIGRSASSVAVNRIDMPLRETSSTSESSSTSSAETSSSPSRRLMAMMPPVRFVSYSVSAVFLTRPSRVASTRILGDARSRGCRAPRRSARPGCSASRLATCWPFASRPASCDLVRLRAVHPARVREEQQPVVGRGDEEVLDHVVGAQLRAAHPSAAAVLAAVVVAAGALDVAAAGEGDDHLLLGDQVLDAHVAVEAEHDLGAAVVAELRRRSRRARR